MASKRALDVYKVRKMKEDGSITERQLQHEYEQTEEFKEDQIKKKESIEYFIEQFKIKLAEEIEQKKQDFETDRFREIQEKYPSLKNLDFEQMKPFREAYDKYMTVKGLDVKEKPPQEPENYNQVKQDLAVVMTKIK